MTLASAEDVSVTLPLHGKPALVLKVPAAAKVTATNGYFKIRTTNLSLYLWPVSEAKSAQDALPRVAEIIKSRFINFKASTTNQMDIVGAPAEDVAGSGNEADDNDSGTAEVVFFEVGRQVFAGCVYGELDKAARERPAMLAVLRTAQAPP